MNSVMAKGGKWSAKKIFQTYGIVIGFFAIVIFLSFASPVFLDPANLVNILRQVSIIGIVSMGMTIVIILGGIDLSVGSGLALVGVVAALVARNQNLPVIVPIICGILAGGLIGLFNGFIIAKGRIVPFIVTLGTMTMARGLAFILANGMPVAGLSQDFFVLGGGSIFGIPFLIILFLAIFGLVTGFLRKTMTGRHIYAIGGNETAAVASGINVDKTKLAAYTLLGLLVGVAGVVLASRIKSGQPAVASGYELDAIAACVIGGVSFSGGVGSAVGTLLGILIIGVINNGLDLLNVQTFYQQIVKGSIIIIAVLMDRKRNS